jgi:CDP-diacylglycerol--glycerol-3-phosphate 3-phosphatidyltransferase
MDVEHANTAHTWHRGSSTLYRVKPGFVAMLDPVRDRLVGAGVRADAVTLWAIPVQVAMATTIAVGALHSGVWIAVAPLAFVLLAVNALDGSLARASGTSTVRGAVLNELVDRFGDLALVGAVFVVAPMWIAVAALAAVAGGELVAAIGWAVTGERTFAGPMGKPDRVVTIAVGATFAVVWGPAIVIAAAAIAVGSAVGVIVRMRTILARARAIDGWPQR